MNDKLTWLVFNLDLENELFTTIVDRIGELSGFDGTFVPIETQADISAIERGEPLAMMVLHTRRLDTRLESISPGLAAVGRLEFMLEIAQLKQKIEDAVLVDCGELPNAPLSDMFVIGQFVEDLSNAMPNARFHGIFAVDGLRIDSDESWSEAQFKWWDTRSEAFIDYMRDNLLKSLSQFNFDPNE